MKVKKRMKFATMKALNNISLKDWNTFGLAVEAANAYIVSSIDDLKGLKEIKKNSELLILGGGSNILFTKNPTQSIIKNEIKGIEIVEETEKHIYVKAGGGEIWHDLVMWSVAQNLGGIENLSLIPGTVGASPIQNIGAYGVEIKDVFESLEAWHIDKEELHTFKTEDCKFDYRNSVFKQEFKGQYLICSVIFRLEKNPTVFKTSYGAIQDELESRGLKPSVKNISDVVIAIRKSKLPDPAEIGNSGSFFKNPIISKEHFEKLLAEYSTMPHYAVEGSTDVKVPAGWLIEKAGWKGFRDGDIGVHAKQALVLVNYGNGKGQDIYELSTKIIEDIKTKFGIELEREVNCI